MMIAPQKARIRHQTGQRSLVGGAGGLKVRSRDHVEEIWRADCRLDELRRMWNSAEDIGDVRLAASLRSKGERIRNAIYFKYDVIL